MNRRHALLVLVGALAGCSENSPEPTSTPTGTPTATATATPSGTETEAPEPTAAGTETTTETPTEGDVEAAVAALNDVYGELRPALESLEATGLDYDLLADRLRATESALAGVTPANAAEEERVRSLSDTRWIFDRLVRTFGRLTEAYGIHAQLLAAYRGSEYTDETATLSAQFRTLAREAASSSGTAVTRYDAMSAFDPALDAQYDAFEPQIFRVSDTANALGPFGEGVDTATRSRQRYNQAVSLYDDGSYRDAQNAFIDLLSAFTDAREEFDEADDLSGPLDAHLGAYRCETRAARLACVEYRAACREQLDGDAAAAERRRAQADEQYTQCSTGGESSG